MPSLKDLRNRIASVKATQKITKAMQMVAAAKLRRAQEAALAARPFSQRMDAVLANLAAAMGNLPGAPQLLTGTGSRGSHLLVVCTAERGLCGAFNASIARLAREHIDRILSEGNSVKILCVGRKGFDILKRNYGRLIIDSKSVASEKGVTVTVDTRRVLSLDSEGNLIVERTGTPASLVTPSRSVYRRTETLGARYAQAPAR